MYQLTFYVPVSHVEIVKQAVFAAGGGQYGLYDHCAWQTLGQGQFRPLANSQPYLGQTGELNQVEEYKVEMICQASYIDAAIKALLTAHPYQQPAYAIYPLLSAEDLKRLPHRHPR